VALSAGCALAGLGCYQKMADQPHVETYESSDFFDDGLSARPLVAGTVARGHLDRSRPLHTGKRGGKAVTSFPVPIDLATLRRGRERFEIFCTPCHDAAGTGRGIVVKRGFRQPSSFHIERLRKAPVGYLFDVVSNGFGTMPSYASQVPVHDRWAIIAYVRALQFSQHASEADVPSDELKQLEASAP
jgi:hypothetical protein